MGKSRLDGGQVGDVPVLTKASVQLRKWRRKWQLLQNIAEDSMDRAGHLDPL